MTELETGRNDGHAATRFGREPPSEQPAMAPKEIRTTDGGLHNGTNG
jgi:hypothetical protein